MLWTHQDHELGQREYLDYQQQLYNNDRMHTVAVWVSLDLDSVVAAFIPLSYGSQRCSRLSVHLSFKFSFLV